VSRKRVAILISGRGSNMAALLDAMRALDFPAMPALVLSNRPDAGGLATAAAAGIPTAIVDHRAHGKDRESFERAMQAEIVAHDIDLVCLAGFMRILTPWFISAWDGRMINIHPSLLPSFRGLDTHARALAEGVALHGCTVHFVVPELDAGPIILQAAVPVLPGDDEATLGARVLAQEHRLYPGALRALATGEVSLRGGRAVWTQDVRTIAAEASLVSPVGV
jgi:phosphoribosylglycinamide formyltransferase-1